MSTLNTDLQKKCINTIRLLAADAVQNANSGHPGMPMGCAPIAHLLYSHIMNHNPANPGWLNRDRFILSAGHGSMLLYSILHLSGYNLSLEDIKQFRQWGSLTPGHPEVHHTAGVETTTGPLGQGVANGVGMAMAYSFLASKFNKPDYKVFDHFIYVLCSDGEIMEGISHEACALAGHNKLGNLILLYDNNKISIEGSTDITMSEDVALRYEAYGWHVQIVDDVNDLDVLETAIIEAKKDDRPSIILVSTNIGYGSPNKQDKSSSHGAPLGKDELLLTKQNLGFPEESFYIADDVKEFYSDILAKGKTAEENWNKIYLEYQEKFPEDSKALISFMKKELPENLDELLPVFKTEEGGLASRAASGKIINKIADLIPNLVGGSADLGESNLTAIHNEKSFSAQNYSGRNIHYGVREHAMASIMNGMSLYGGIIPFGGTFLVFIDYMRSPMRMAALMNLQVIYILTHDSIGLGEDGPTHQPIEHIANLRAVPGLTLFRPADANETVYAWKYAVKKTDGPTAIALSRQKLSTLDRSKYGAAENTLKGGYVLKDSNGTPELILLSAGSEVEITLKAAETLETDGVKVRVVSMPSFDIFEKQSQEYKEQILPRNVTKRISVEAGTRFGWERYVGFDGDYVSIESFGASAPAEVLYEKFGITAENIVSKAKNILNL